MSLRESIFSIGSRMLQKQEDDVYFDDMTYEELQQTQDDLLQKIWMITLENDVYERYLTRYDPHSLRTITNLLERARLTRRVTSFMIPKSSRMSFRESIMGIHDLGRHSITSATSVTSIGSGSRLRTSSILTTGTTGEAPKITIAHRMAMAKKEAQEMRNGLEEFKESARKRKAYMRAEIEELEIRISEAHEAREEFEDEVIVKGVDRITGKIPGERITRFIEEWLRSASMIIQRLRLKSATLKTRIAKARQQLIQREELGEALHAVDFEQLNIENQDYVKMIEEKSRYVLDMKRIAGHYHLKLTQRKQKLNDLFLALNELKEEISAKQQQIKQLKSEHEVVEVNVKRKEALLKNLLAFMENHIAPGILDFVELQAEYEDLKKTHKVLQRRRDIDRIILQAYKKQIQRKYRVSVEPSPIQ